MSLRKLTLSNNEKLGLFANLATMISAGIPIVEAAESLAEDAKGNLKKILDEMIHDTMQGQPLNVTLAKFPLVFDKVSVNIIKASESAGTLDVALKDLKDNLKKDIEFMDKVKSALTYPMVILAVFAGVVVLMLTFVIPKISKVFLQLRVVLPLPTKILVYTSDFIMNNVLLALLIIAVFLGVVIYLSRTQKRALINFVLGLPLIKNLAKGIDLTRFSRSMYLLLNSGIPITTALEFASEIVNQKDLSQALTDSREQVIAGHPLSDGLKNHRKVFPSIMIKIIEAGEKSGSLEKSMTELSEHFDYEVSKILRALMALLEPVILVVVGVFIGALMIAIIAPIYGLISQVGAPR